MNFGESNFSITDLIMFTIFALLILIVFLKKIYMKKSPEYKIFADAVNTNTDRDNDTDISSQTTSKSSKSNSNFLLNENEPSGYSAEELGYPIQ